MSDLKDKLEEINNKYSERLKMLGLELKISKKYFESMVGEGHGGPSSSAVGLLNQLSRSLDRRREKKYKNQPNRYHCIVISLVPAAKDKMGQRSFREYAFLIRKTERAHLGLAPEEKVYAKEKLAAKIDKRIEKLIKKAEGSSSKKACTDSARDLFRYVFSKKYLYKDSILGKDASFWDLVFSLAALLAALIIIIIAYLSTRA
ncbi:MAG: hypothetical protein E7646_02145 [Ruminococcaceae bacterium]|nr:hypothetical protein [Oscillospiraceae bacterium]